MRIIIVGAGLVGVRLARRLIEEKHDVAIIEANEERARHASNRLDCMVFHDEGNSVGALEEAGIAEAGALVCVTDSDEVNMIICGLAARYPRVLKIARVRNDEYVQRNFQNQVETEPPFGINYFVHPDVEAARSALDAIEHGAAGNILSFAGTPFELAAIDITAGSSFDGMVLNDFRSVLEGESLITLVERKGAAILPTGATRLEGGDRIYLLAREEELNKGFELAGRPEKPIRKIGIVGGGRIGSLVAAGLLSKEKRKNGTADNLDEDGPPFINQKPERLNKKKTGFFSFLKTLVPRRLKKVVIIEPDYGICKELAARYPEALVLNEDISDESFAAEEKMGDLDLIVTATDIQEQNIITAVYLKSLGVARAVAMVSGGGYAAIARQLGVDVVIPMKSVVVDSILSKLIGVKGVHRLGDGTTGILDINVSPGSPAEGRSLKDFRLPEGALVMLVSRTEGDFIPRGDYVYTAGHRLLVVAQNGTEMEIEKIFGVPR